MTVEGKVAATNVVGNSTGTTLITRNPYLYRGCRYDRETGLYYLNSRYYDPETGRFLNADVYVNTGQNTIAANMFQYCGNNPINRIDPLGYDWWHWLLGAAVVVGCAAATVVTCGGFAAAAAATAAVATGTTVASTSSAIAASALLGSSVVYGVEVLNAVASSNSLEEFENKGNWGTVIKTAGGGIVGAGYSYYSYNAGKTNKHTVEDNTLFESRGSTAKYQPSNLTEQLVLEEVKSNPTGRPIDRITMSDPRWPASEGWVKAQVIRETYYGNVVVHYVTNPGLRLFDDFKIIK